MPASRRQPTHLRSFRSFQFIDVDYITINFSKSIVRVVGGKDPNCQRVDGTKRGRGGNVVPRSPRRRRKGKEFSK